MNDLKDRYRQQRAPMALAAELENEFARREVRRNSLLPTLAGTAATVLVAVAALWTYVGQPEPDAAHLAALDEAPMRPSPAALTARTSEFGQLSVSRLSLPSNTNLAGVTSMPVLPTAPRTPATL